MLRIARAVTLAGSLAIACLGVLAGGASLLAGLLAGGSEKLMLVTLGSSILALSGGLGLAMAWQSWQSIQAKPSRPFRLQRTGLLVVTFLCAVALGQLALSRDLMPVLVLPPLHVLAAVLPPVVVLALVARGLAATSSWRDAVLQLGSGAFLSTALALGFELVLLVGLVVVLLIAALVYGGPDALEPILGQLQDPAILQDPSALAPLALSAPVIVALFLVVAVAIPIIEEAVKTVGVGLFSYRRPTKAESFFWGVACGAGFGLAEGLLNTIGGLDSWGAVVLLRLGATLLHCLTGGLMGIAWYMVVSERRWARGLGLFACSVSIHGFWNAVSISLTLVSLTGMVNQESLAGYDLSALATMVLFALLAAAILATGVGLVALTRCVRHTGVTSDASGNVQAESPVQVEAALSTEPKAASPLAADDDPAG